MTRRTSSPGLGLLDGSGDLWTDVLLLGGAGCAVLAVAGSVVWLAGASLSLVTGHDASPSLVEAAQRFGAAHGLAGVWPDLSPSAVVLVSVVYAVALTWAGWWSLQFMPWLGTDSGLAGPKQFADLLPGRTGTAKTRRLRPSLPKGSLSPSELGVPLGRLTAGRWAGGRGQAIRASWEDVVLAICAPRSGKTMSLAVPAILDAPGAVLVTSNKGDAWQLTRRVRQADTGQRVWTFDPQAITGEEQQFAWDALAGVSTVGDARRLAGHFVQEIRRNADSADFWDRDAEDLLTGLLLAAALVGAPLSKVAIWLTSVSSVEPRNILARHGFEQLAEVMAGRSQGAHETREGVYATARAAAACLTDPQIMAWVTPQPGLDVFDPAAFVTSRQTVFLLSKDGAGSAAPLVAAFADRLMLEAVRAAERMPGGRLDPPMVAVLDEAANVCRITELPRLYSHLGSRGVVPVTILQSRSQGRRVWGEAGMDELFSAATVKVIGAGIDEPAFAEDVSRLVGEHDVRVTTRNGGRNGGVSVTTRRERVLAADEIRALPKFTALLLVTGVRPARLRLIPWMAGSRARDLKNQDDAVPGCKAASKGGTT